MEKSEVFFKIQEMPEDSSIAGTIVISAYNGRNRNARMLEAHVVEEFFPELSNENIGDLSEGEMEYWGNLNIEQLKAKLFDLGFNII